MWLWLKLMLLKIRLEGFPKLTFFVYGEISEYKGGINTAAIVSWLFKRKAMK